MASVFLIAAKLLAGVIIVDFAYTSIIGSDATSIIEMVTTGLPSIYDFFVSLKDFIISLLEVFPSPFTSVIRVFLLMFFMIFMWKLIKGGGS